MSAAQPGELREALAEVVQAHRNMGIRDGAWACFCSQRFSDLAAWLAHQADALLPVVTAYAERLARERAAEEIERLADEYSWTTQHDSEVVSTRELYEQVARLRGELEPLTFDFPPAADQPVQP